MLRLESMITTRLSQEHIRRVLARRHGDGAALDNDQPPSAVQERLKYLMSISRLIGMVRLAESDPEIQHHEGVPEVKRFYSGE